MNAAERLQADEHQHRHAYAFTLRDGQGGGTYITEAPTTEQARAELAQRYGDRLRTVEPRGGERK